MCSGYDGPLTAGLQGLDGMFFIARRAVVEAVPFDEETFDGFHGYDLDFSFAAHLAGFSVGTSAEIAVIHASGGTLRRGLAALRQPIRRKAS